MTIASLEQEWMTGKRRISDFHVKSVPTVVSLLQAGEIRITSLSGIKISFSLHLICCPELVNQMLVRYNIGLQTFVVLDQTS